MVRYNRLNSFNLKMLDRIKIFFWFWFHPRRSVHEYFKLKSTETQNILTLLIIGFVELGFSFLTKTFQRRCAVEDSNESFIYFLIDHGFFIFSLVISYFLNCWIIGFLMKKGIKNYIPIERIKSYFMVLIMGGFIYELVSFFPDLQSVCGNNSLFLIQLIFSIWFIISSIKIASEVLEINMSRTVGVLTAAWIMTFPFLLLMFKLKDMLLAML